MALELVFARYVTSFPVLNPKSSKLKAPKLLPNLAKQLAADFRFARCTPAHQAAGRGQNADAQPANDRTNSHRAGVTPGAGARDALDAGDDAAAVRGVLQENAQHLASL